MKALACWVFACSVLTVVGCKTVNAKGHSGLAASFGETQSRASWLKPALYTSLDDYPVAAAPGNEIVTILFELPKGGTDVGHVAMMVGDDVFDYGPAINQERGLFDFHPLPFGGRYWSDWRRLQIDRKNATATAQNLLPKLAELTHEHTTLMIPIEVTAEHAANIRGWWTAFYQSRPRYGLASGVHCTSAVIKAFETSDPTYKAGMMDRLAGSGTWFPGLTSPTDLAMKLLNHSTLSWNQQLRYEHSGGTHASESLKALVVFAGPELENTGIKPAASIDQVLAKLQAGRDAAQKAAQAEGDNAGESGHRDSSTTDTDAARPGEDGSAARKTEESRHGR